MSVVNTNGVYIAIVCLLFLLQRNLGDESVEVPSSCIGLKDGEYIIKLVDDDNSPLVNVVCSNEYMLIDIDRDESWKSYFTSMQMWHYDIAGPERNDRVNYNEWFIPAPAISDDRVLCPNMFSEVYDKSVYTKETYPTKYLISPECDICDSTDTYHQQYEDKTTYQMNAAAYGLFFGLRRPACDFNWDTYECKMCDWTIGTMQGFPRPLDLAMEDTAQNNRSLPNAMFGVCLTEVRSAFQCVTKDQFYQFTMYGIYNYKPSIGVHGRFCQCAQIVSDENKYISVSAEEYNNKLLEIEESKIEPPEEKEDDNNIYYLYQSDFEIGTYRITKSGTYIIMEDIIFNFGPQPPDDVDWDIDSPNDPSNDYWWPLESEKYPGSGYKAREGYMLGYFAGITIETHDVILDLNGYTIKQSKEYFYQQPFFTNIELCSQPFLPNQGPGFFGADPQFAENVIIKNGVLGRSSHHGIHGSRNKNIRIENVHILDFMTHGIQINGFDGLHLENIEIGPTVNDCYLNHNYAHLRILLPYLYKLANYDAEHMEKTISFDPRSRTDEGRIYTMNDLVDIAVEKLDKMYKYVMSDKFNIDDLASLAKYDDDFKLFINADGLPYGGVVYGMYLNYPGSGIFGWDVSDQRTDNLYMKNIEIHDLYHSGNEIFALSKDKQRLVVNTLLAPLNMEHIFGSKLILKDWIDRSYNDINNEYILRPQYVGNIATDIYFAMYYFGSDRFDEWWLAAPYISYHERLIDWVQGNDDDAISTEIGGLYWEPECSLDGMSHAGKGIVGIKLTNADNVIIDSGTFNIYNLFDVTPLSEEGICITPANQFVGYGKDDVIKVSSVEQAPYQTAFSMNQIFGFSIEFSDIKIHQNVEININNLKSNTGRILGMISWYDTKIKFNENAKLNIYDLYAGINVEKGKFKYIDDPNHEPEVCSFAIYNAEKAGVVSTILLPDADKQIKQECIYGNIGCWGNLRLSDLSKVENDEKCLANLNNMNLAIKYKNNYNSFNYAIYGVIAIAMIIIIIIKYYKSYKNNFKYIPIAD